MTKASSRQQALAERDAFPLQPTSLVGYQSQGRIAVLGPVAELERCQQLPPGLDLQPESAAQFVIDGYLGNFAIDIVDDAGQSRQLRADAVLDLHPSPLLERELPPPGYFHWPAGVALDGELVEALEDLAGEFEKPRYFVYDPSICAHGVNGKTVCSNCIDACPAEAIHSIGETIEVDPHLCQGGGSCTSVCPSGAIRYLYPTVRDNGMRLRKTLQSFVAAGGGRPSVLFHTENCAIEGLLEADSAMLPIAVEELASVGPELCLAALAYGATRVLLLADGEVPPRSRHSLQQQLDWLQPLLQGLGLDPRCISLIDAGERPEEIGPPAEIEPAIHDMPMAKRDAVFRALDHLVAQLAPALEPIELPAPAPFGEVGIDAGKCTLCMACVGACPGRALQDGSNREVPEVFFIESNCLQCGACVTTCPEDAVSLHPRLLLEHESRIRARSLNRDIPFACISCGKPFAPGSVIDKMLDKLKDHHMFSNQRALDRLKMCEDCRVVDIVDDPAAMGGQFDPLKGFREGDS